MHPCFRLAKRPVLRRMAATSSLGENIMILFRKPSLVIKRQMWKTNHISPGMTETEHFPTPAIFTLHAIR